MKIKNYFNFFENQSLLFKLYFLFITIVSILIVFMDAVSIFTLLPIMSITLNGGGADKFNTQLDLIPEFIFSLQENLDLKLFIILFVIILLFRNILHIVNNYIIFKFTKHIEIETSKKSFFLILKKKYLELNSQTSSGLIKDLRDSLGGYVLFVESVSRVISDFIILALFTLFLFYLSFIETLIIYTYFLVILIFFNKSISRISVSKGQQTNLYAEKINLTIINTYKNFAQIILRRLNSKYLKQYIFNIKIFTYSRLIIVFLKTNIKQFLEIFILLFVFIIFIILSKFNTYNDGKLLSLISVYIISAYRMMPLINNLAGSMIKLKNLTFPYSIINNNIRYFNRKYKSVKFDKKQIQKITFEKSLELKNIKFSYSKKQNLIINNLNLKILKNEMIGIIGPSGYGKSTLIKIILGLIDQTNGEIKIDGKKIQSSNKEKYQLLFGYLPQQNLFIPGTIKENIAFGEDEVNEEKVIQVLKKTNSFNFVKNLKNKINYKLDEDGKNFSSGQLQRFALARALYFDNDIIVLDEPTSSLDKNNEKKFITLIKNLKKLKTIIIVSHKMNTLRHCDKIFHMDKCKLKKLK